ncbi:hypothetical protein C0992_003119 [Termitomyces sp. T32_za158]|nr:hypothetical protein C0992_003119 [Termitomyces sp. T32_za158]
MEELARAPGLMQFLDKAELTSEVKSTADYSYSACSYAGPGYRIVGDAGANLKLLLPTSLSALKLDLGRLWLTRTLRKSQLRSNLPPPEEHFHAADDQPRVRTPVFTLPPVLNADPPSHASILPIPTPMPMPMPIKLPKLLSLSLTLALPEPETICDWADQPSVTFSPKGNVHSATPATRARGVSAVEREVGDARYVSPLLRSPPPSSRDFVESEGWECEWNLMRLEREDDGWGDDDYDEDEDGEEEFDSL